MTDWDVREIARGIITANLWPIADGPFVRVNDKPRDIEKLAELIAAALLAERERAQREAGAQIARLMNERDAQRDALQARLASVENMLDWKPDSDAASDDRIFERGYAHALSHLRALLQQP